ncbi:ABC transporter permease subunit [Sinosporangium siamense]|uniref:ABC transporter n=1 Tax=Sinosporangium siamense TaxID=1367973 RepID=A0A919RPD2_9ACTN|nr:ABC transporter permease subunit [Sinosporangium siamense]GII95951.1 ABC transporter [Sinosporangium siamense]
MSVATVRGVVVSEWTKVWSVPSTLWTLLLTVAVSVGFGRFVAGALSGPDVQGPADPLFAAFYSLTFGQLAIVVFGALVVGGEYSAGTIRASLSAVPRRGLFYTGKLLAATGIAVVVSVVTVFVTFFVTQSALGVNGVTLSDEGVPAAVAGACLYLTLITLFATGVAAMLRNPTLTLGILLPIFFLGAQGVGNVPGLKSFAQYLPDQAGSLIMHLAGPQDDPRWARDYGPWTGVGILALWAIAALVGGYLVMRRRDA